MADDASGDVIMETIKHSASKAFVIAYMTTSTVRVIALGHVLASLLITIDKSGYGGRPRGTLGHLADHPAWAMIHLAAAFIVIFTASPRWQVVAAAVSASVMGVWSILMLWWATSLDPDATWVAGVLGLIAAAHAVAVADKSARLDED